MSRIKIIKQAVLKFILAFGAIVVSVQLFRLMILPAIESVFLPDEFVTSMIRRTGIFLCVLLSYWAYVKFYEKRVVTELQIKPIGIAAGAFSGAMLVVISALPLFLFGIYQVTVYRGFQSGLFGVACVIVIAAFMEEVVYRGILFRIFEQACGTTKALWLQALIFSLMHLGNNSEASLSALIWNVVSGTLIGAFWTYIFVHTRNLWIVVANHAAWNYAIILTGTPLSGIDSWRIMAPIESVYHGPFWLSGGVFGPEDSVVTNAIIIVCLTLQMHWSRKSNARIRQAQEKTCPTASRPIKWLQS